jgi:hypothetical protein
VDYDPKFNQSKAGLPRVPYYGSKCPHEGRSNVMILSKLNNAQKFGLLVCQRCRVLMSDMECELDGWQGL